MQTTDGSREKLEICTTVENLQFFYEKTAVDGVAGLENKLKAAGRESEYILALRKKEHFVKLLEKWSKYASAQEIFAYLLADVEHQFSMHVYPKLDELDGESVNKIVDELIVQPTIIACGTTIFTLNASVVMGMLYWLAEQCFVRWHR